MTPFVLDTRLEADTFRVGESALNLLLLMNDSRYPWCILVPKQTGLREIYELSTKDQSALLIESSLLAKTIMTTFMQEKINIGALGNVVSQLHIHHVGRRQNDPAWPAPVWGHSQATPYSSDSRKLNVQALSQSALADHFTF
ncbi:MAG: HIT family protein [Pseudomonadales bacterium]|nr:HIT family protein [Pseudomonadales bacterium]